MSIQKVYSYSLVCFVLFALVFSLIENKGYEYQNTIENTFRFFLFITLFYFERHYDRLEFKLIVFSLLYLSIYILRSYQSGVYYLDILNANVFIIYTLIFSQTLKFLLKAKCNYRFYEFFFKFLLIAFFLIYFVKRVLLGIGRPFVYGENNFELMLVFISFYSLMVKELLTNIKLWWLLLFGIVILSGSKSGLLILLFLIFYKLNFQIIYIFILGLIIIIFLGVLSSYISSLDRFVFLLSAINSIKIKEVIELFLPLQLLPLNQESCTALSFYTGSMNPDSNDCYPKILHIWLLSSFLNHGLIVIVLYLKIFYELLKNYFKKDYLFLFAVPIINGLSVSGFDSIWYFFSLILIFPLWMQNTLPLKSS